ncbi:MAG: GNAT family N-acetyltransferase [Hydrogenophaga sp.]
MTNVRVRSATAEDIRLLPAIEQSAAERFPPSDLPAHHAQTTPLEELRQGLAAKTLWVAEGEGAQVIGFMLCRVEGSSLHIAEMDVLPDRAGRGAGSRLLEAAFVAAIGMGLRSVTLTTFEHLPWNAPFYARRGFQPVADLSDFPHLGAALQAEAVMGLRRRVAMVWHPA